MQTDASVIKMSTSLIVPNKNQPRKIFDDKTLNNLAESIKNYGIINPILVRQKDDKYEIIAGERRFRAAKKIGLTEVPVIVKSVDEQLVAELALIENIQRQDLNPIEIAKSYEEILRIGNQTQESLAKKLGKSQSSVANKIRLLSLPQEIQEALKNKQIGERHARSLLSVSDKSKQLELLNRIITEKLTVKEIDQIINSKEINEEEIKQAISDIMKSLNIKEEEKEDDNMNNGNFFPNFDNNAVNNNASLNMMNMQSMNQAPITPEPEVVMPTMPTPQEPQLAVPPQPTVAPIQEPVVQPQVLTPSASNQLNPMADFMPSPEPTLMVPPAPTMETPIINEAPLFGPQINQPAPTIEPPVPTPMIDEPLFNPNLSVPTQEPQIVPPAPVEPPVAVSEPTLIAPTPFEVPVNNQPAVEMPVVGDKLTELQNLLTNNGYSYKTYSNNDGNCIIIELPKN